MNPIILLLATLIIQTLAIPMTSSYAFTATTAGTATAKGFSHPTLSPPITTSTTELTYESLHNAQTQLNANAASVHFNSRGRHHVHLMLTMPPAEFTLLPNVIVFNAPVCPPDHPVHPRKPHSLR